MRKPWLDPDEQEELVADLLRWELLKFSNRRDLPLKMGGTTDIYLNLRDARSNPEAIRRLAGTYSHPLRRLRLVRFAEVPDAVSCFAGPISIETGLPYVTVREEAKAGRVTKGRTIGALNRGDRVAILDDVITDGASKIIPYRELVSAGAQAAALIVLVDREQGWRKTFAAENIALPVWPGLTLHNVRRILIGNGVMERCNPRLEEQNPIIVALDGKERVELFALADRLRPTGCILKVNDLVFDEGIANLVSDLSVYGRLMIDLKSHDIPNTVMNVCKRLARHAPWAVTVHASGGEEMVRNAMEALKGTGTKVLAITVLTSLRPEDCEEVYSRRPGEEVKKLAAIAMRAGADGLVCSPEEVGMLRALYPQATLVTPGIRSEGVSKGDQQRTGTPQGALAAGSSNLVMGRQILGAEDPVAEVKRVLTDELGMKI